MYGKNSFKSVNVLKYLIKDSGDLFGLCTPQLVPYGEINIHNTVNSEKKLSTPDNSDTENVLEVDLKRTDGI